MLSSDSPFIGLSADDLFLLSQKGQLRKFPKNAVVITAGDTGNQFYYIEHGGVKIFSSDKQGKELLLRQLGPGEYFGELALFDDAPRSVSVMTVAPTAVRVITRDVFYAHLEAYPNLAPQLIRGLSSLIRSLTQQVANLALLDVYGRLRGALLELSVVDGDRRVIPQAITHQDLANRIGASREMVSRIMKTLTDGAYVQAGRKHIVIERELPERW